MPTNWTSLLFPASAGVRPQPRPAPGDAPLSPAFRTKVGDVARRLQMDPQHLMAVMSFETGGTFSAKVRNQAGSGATGLIQFMPATARGLGTTTEALAQMTPEQQLDYVEKYLKPYARRMQTQQDAYLAVLSPAAIGKPAEHVLFQQGTRAYEQNRGLDTERKGYVTVGDTTASMARHLGARGTAAPQPVDWAAELFGAPAAAPSVTQDWGTALGLGGGLSALPAGSVAAPASAPTLRDWGGEPGLAGGISSPPGVGSAPPQQVDWRAELL